MKPESRMTKIFLDSGDPAETKAAVELLGFLDGQTTNPSLIAKNPATAGKKFRRGDLLDFYKKVVQEVSGLIPQGSVSIEVYADPATTSEEMLRQGREFFSWIGNAHIKFPTTKAGLEAAHRAVKEGIRVNMTLVFSQAQAAAVHAATLGAKKGDVFLSPFVGRLDDIGENGMDLIENIVRLYRQVNSHVQILTASVRSLGHFTQALEFGSDIITAPPKVLKAWAESGFAQNVQDKPAVPLKSIVYQDLDLKKPWSEFDPSHPLTDAGLQKFADDWNALLQK